MTPFDGEGREYDIHKIIGSFRRRVNELSSGIIHQTYEMHNSSYQPINGVIRYIDEYDPNDILKYLNPLLVVLDRIDLQKLQIIESAKNPFSALTDEEELNIELGKVREEIKFYRTELHQIICRYSQYSTLGPAIDNIPNIQIPENVFRYNNSDPADRIQKLENFQNALREYIDMIDLNDFNVIFSGTGKKIDKPINWKDDANLHAYLIMKLSAHPNIKVKFKWKAASNCFLLNGNRKTADQMKGNWKKKKPDRADDIDIALGNL